MPLFRFHRGGLSDSLKTTIIVKNLNDVVKAIVTSDLIDTTGVTKNWGAEFKVIPYPSEDNNFDARIGWYTHMVLANIYEKDKMQPIGFLSEPLD